MGFKIPVSVYSSLQMPKHLYISGLNILVSGDFHELSLTARVFIVKMTSPDFILHPEEKSWIKEMIFPSFLLFIPTSLIPPCIIFKSLAQYCCLFYRKTEMFCVQVGHQILLSSITIITITNTNDTDGTLKVTIKVIQSEQYYQKKSRCSTQ